MRKILLLLAIIFVFTTLDLWAQGITINLEQSIHHHMSMQKTGMIILGSWGLGNALTGGIGMLKSQGETKYFHQMNLGWGLINASIAGLGYFSALKTGGQIGEWLDLFQQNQSMQRTLLLNAGLDVGYIMGGLYLVERSRRPEINQQRLKGFGKSIVLQGAFLLAFDGLMAWQFLREGKEIFELLSTADGLGLSIKF